MSAAMYITKAQDVQRRLQIDGCPGGNRKGRIKREKETLLRENSKERSQQGDCKIRYHANHSLMAMF